MPDMNQIQMPNQAQAQMPNQAPAFDDNQFKQMMMQWLMTQLSQPQQNQQGQQVEQKPEEEMMGGWEELKKLLMGQGEFGYDPHFSTLENILSRLKGPGDTSARPAAENLNSSAMNAQRLASQPLTTGQKIGQTLGNVAEGIAPMAGYAGGLMGGPLGAMGGYGAAKLGGMGMNYISQPYKLPTAGR